MEGHRIRGEWAKVRLADLLERVSSEKCPYGGGFWMFEGAKKCRVQR